jgi:hypothetical protein
MDGRKQIRDILIDVVGSNSKHLPAFAQFVNDDIVSDALVLYLISAVENNTINF